MSYRELTPHRALRPFVDRLWIRAWDEKHTRRETFQLPESYPLSPEWRVSARFDPFPEPKDIQVGDVVEGTQVYHAPGELVFRIAGREYRLAVSADSGSRDYFIMLWDSTATTTTYGAGSIFARLSRIRRVGR